MVGTNKKVKGSKYLLRCRRTRFGYRQGEFLAARREPEFVGPGSGITLYTTKRVKEACWFDSKFDAYRFLFERNRKAFDSGIFDTRQLELVLEIR